MLFTLLPKFPLAGYIIYSHMLIYAILAALYRRIPMGIKGVTEIWTGKKAIAISLLLLCFLVIGATAYPGFNIISFGFSLPFGGAYGWWIYNLFNKAKVPLV